MNRKRRWICVILFFMSMKSMPKVLIIVECHIDATVLEQYIRKNSRLLWSICQQTLYCRNTISSLSSIPMKLPSSISKSFNDWIPSVKYTFLLSEYVKSRIWKGCFRNTLHVNCNTWRIVSVWGRFISLPLATYEQTQHESPEDWTWTQIFFDEAVGVWICG